MSTGQLSEKMQHAIARLAALLPDGDELAATNAAQMLNDAADTIQELRAEIRALRGVLPDVVWRDGQARVGVLRVSLSRVTDSGWHAVFRHDDCASDLALLTCVDDDQGRVERLVIAVAREMQR